MAYAGSGERRVDGIGFTLVIASALCYSSLGILGKIAFDEGVSLLSLLSTRFTIGAALLWGFVALVPGIRRALRAMSWRRVAGIFVWGVVGFAGQSTLFFSTLQSIPAGLTVLLLYTCPAFMALIVWGLTRRRPTVPRLVAIGLALAGTCLCAGPIGGAVDLGGVGLGIATGFWFAVFLLGLHRLTGEVPAVISGALIAAGAAVAFDGAALFGGAYQWPPNLRAWGAILGMVGFATIVGFVLLVIGMRRVGPQITSILSTFEPLGALLLAAVVLGERLIGPQWIGAALIVGASFALASSPAPDEGMEPALN